MDELIEIQVPLFDDVIGTGFKYGESSYISLREIARKLNYSENKGKDFVRKLLNNQELKNFVTTKTLKNGSAHTLGYVFLVGDIPYVMKVILNNISNKTKIKVNKYKPLKEITDNEINFILKNILNMEKLVSATRLDEQVFIETKLGDFNLELELKEHNGYMYVNCLEKSLKEHGLGRNFVLDNDKVILIRKYLFSVGICSMLKNNPFIKK